ncbi:mitochondrial 54S ribosomal protein uL10m ASCRUDRAFT_31882 [Ascoidea rubescens DSM 1968]|uniref:Ribosomal protein L10 n=1 Tax=Ascoidea rubescens DSM 1968 TaxID=1344418 RepID=A0A1D2VMC4_9ASCO|nr:hypothetical protein ASCRUDRAFT_31882 [Ascoidea rubescens DSM 1968]ODV62763.1 hypothetical protein ASCRUDRAFT_31882 [Ascoidea rubescens DSM 1968]
MSSLAARNIYSYSNSLFAKNSHSFNALFRRQKHFNSVAIINNHKKNLLIENKKVVRTTIKPIDSRKTFLIDFYKDILDNNSIILFLHHNNLTKTENFNLRSRFIDILSKDGKQEIGSFHIIRNKLFRVLLRNYYDNDPASIDAKSEEVEKLDTEKFNKFLDNEKLVNKLLPILNGPTAVLTIKETNPMILKKLITILNSTNEKLILMAAKVENSIFDLDDINQFKNLPSKENLQSQLVGLLTILSGAGLVRTLEATTQSLYLHLKSHEDNINPNKADSNTEETSQEKQ